MSNPITRNNGGERIKRLENSLMVRGIVFDKIEYNDELNTCLIFFNTHNISAIEIIPIAEAVKTVNAELLAVIDNAKDQLCFFVVFR